MSNRNQPAIANLSSVEIEDSSWENEDPNLLNDPTLLYKETASLPLINYNEDCLERITLIRDLVLDNNFIQETISKRDEIVANKETAIQVIKNMDSLFEAMNNDCFKKLEEAKCLPHWDDRTKNEIFSDATTQKVQRWKTVFNAFLENYSRIREFIPKEILDDNASMTTFEDEKRQFQNLPLLVEELERLLNAIKFMD